MSFNVYYIISLSVLLQTLIKMSVYTYPGYFRKSGFNNDMITFLQQSLLILLHTRNCPTINLSLFSCDNPVCKYRKLIVQHVFTCQDRFCNIPRCNISRFLLTHWRKCFDIQCDLCNPVKKIVRRYSLDFFVKSTPTWRVGYDESKRNAIIQIV